MICLWRWVGWQYTRAVFIEFNVYNPNLDSFGVFRLNFEFSRYGGIVSTITASTPALVLYAVAQFAIETE